MFALRRRVLASCAVCLATCVLDILLLLPHPAGQLRGSPGMAGTAVRAKYYERIALLTERVASLRAGLSSVGSEVEDLGSRSCQFAAVVIDGCEAARLESHLYGSAAMHTLLRLRDVVKNRSLRPPTLGEHLHRKRWAIRISSGHSPTLDEACIAIAESWLKLDERFALAMTHAEQDLSYEAETCIVYAGMCMVILIGLCMESIVRDVTERMTPLQLSHRMHREEPESETEVGADMDAYEKLRPSQQEKPHGSQERRDKKRL